MHHSACKCILFFLHLTLVCIDDCWKTNKGGFAEFDFVSVHFEDSSRINYIATIAKSFTSNSEYRAYSNQTRVGDCCNSRKTKKMVVVSVVVHNPARLKQYF